MGVGRHLVREFLVKTANIHFNGSKYIEFKSK